MEEIISYIIRFLLNGEGQSDVSDFVGYTKDPREYDKYKVIITPSSFFDDAVFGTDASLPALPLPTIENIPLLFGESKVELLNDRLLVHGDIIASTFFLITRYEETLRRSVRDSNGRFPGKESLLYRASIINRPIVDEYGALLRAWLRQMGVNISEPDNQIKKIWLTHDVDAPFYCRTFRNVLRETIRGGGFRKATHQYKQPLTSDAYYTFPWLAEQNSLVRNAVGDRRFDSILFLKNNGRSRQDKPDYDMGSKDFRELMALWKENNFTFGLHSSYDASLNPSLIPGEKVTVEKATQEVINYNRHHFLAIREPEDMEWLIKAGITDDFSLGYADVAGFRLGTCRPVHWIDPIKKQLTSLIMHPLIIMDVSLSEEKYMGLSNEEALSYCKNLFSQIARVGGELVLLWHNDVISEAYSSNNRHRKLYEKLIKELCEA